MKTLFLALSTLFITTITLGQDYPDDCMDNLLIPEKFSPNGDAMNDAFVLQWPCPSETFKISIFDRWGSTVFESEDPKFEWYGTTDDKPLNEGVYIYVIDFTFNGGEFNKKGNVTLIK